MKLTISTIDPRCLNDERGVPVCQVLTEEMAQDVVRIVNAHDDLVASNNDLRDQVEEIRQTAKTMRDEAATHYEENTRLRERNAALVTLLEEVRQHGQAFSSAIEFDQYGTFSAEEWAGRVDKALTAAGAV